MIKFFRKIRQKLITENRFSKYLIYAIGEIVLVVIGILIALYINNNNEQKKKDLEANKLLIQIQDDLHNAVGALESQRESYQKKDSLYRIIMSDTLTMEDMMEPKNYNLHRFTYEYHPYIILKEGYNSYINKVDQFSEEYTNLEPDLKKLYSEFDLFYGLSQKKIEEVLERQYAYARDKKWYPNVWNSHNLQPEFADYLLNDHRLKNEARTYYNYVFSLVGVTTRFQMQAVNLYKRLHKITQQPKELPKQIKDYFVEKPVEYYNELVGTYDFIESGTSNSLTIEYKDTQLYVNDVPAFLKNGNEIISDNFPANIWKYDSVNRTMQFSLLGEGKKRYKLK